MDTPMVTREAGEGIGTGSSHGIEVDPGALLFGEGGGRGGEMERFHAWLKVTSRLLVCPGVLGE